MKKVRRKGWFQKEEAELYRIFQHRRLKKLKVSTLWVSVTLCKLLLKNQPNDAKARAVAGSRRWANNWARKHNLSHRRKRNSKNKSVEERLPKIQTFHKRSPQLLNEPRRLAGQVVVAEPQQEEAAITISALPSAVAAQRPVRNP